MATITFIAAYVLLMTVTIPVMRWMFRAELQEVVKKTIHPAVERTNQLSERLMDLVGDWQPIENVISSIVKPIVAVSVPQVSYSTSTNVLTIVNDNGEIIEFNMFKKSDEALSMVEALVQKAAMLEDEAEEILDDLSFNQTKHRQWEMDDDVNFRFYRGHEWGVKSKVKK